MTEKFHFVLLDEAHPENVVPQVPWKGTGEGGYTVTYTPPRFFDFKA